jgi:hypothetical protein
MPRLVIVALFALGCSKSATNQDTGSKTGGNTPDERIAVPTGAGAPEGAASKGAAVDSPQLRLSPDEGKLAIEAPADAKPGAEVIAKVMVVANPAFKVNLEFPTSIKLEAPPQGVTIAKAELKAGGQSKAKGDADVFDDKQATFLVKLTPAASGTYTINGNFKFAVCDRAGTQCFPKKEPIAIQIAAK